MLSEAGEPIIRVRGLVNRFGVETVHDGVDLDVLRGEVIGIVGGSGSGKSVLLRTIIGLNRPVAGRVEVFGRDVWEMTEHQRRQLENRWGVLFQDGALFSSLTVAQNVEVPIKEYYNMPLRLMDEISAVKVSMVGLPGDAGDKYPSQLSGGMRKRAGLARALVLDPEIILFDEPDSGLDPVRTSFLNELVLDLKEQTGSTMIIVTHHIPSAQQIADYIGLLFRRRLVSFGPKEDMFTSNDPVVKQFLAGSTDGPIGMSEEKDRPSDEQGNGS
jgi:phospholipid/cholesterol/gamma-HCH transport system ATP-binding protein